MRSCKQYYWQGPIDTLQTGSKSICDAVSYPGRPVFVLKSNDSFAVTHVGNMICEESNISGHSLCGYLPPLPPTELGDSSFKKDLGLRYAYVVGAMANGITSVQMVTAAGKAGMIGFFGAGGLTLDQVDSAIHQLRDNSDAVPFGFNLIHSPNDPELEKALVTLYLKRGIRLVSASAYLGITAALVYYRIKGIHQEPNGRIRCANHVIAKVSREEVARKFFAPPPEKIVSELLKQGQITEHEAGLSQQIPLAQDMTAEADSGGHTDNRPALTLLPTFLAVRDEAVRRYGYQIPLRVGLGGGIATPEATAAAFAMGAAYVLTGSINQACVEADTSEIVRDMLVKTQQADVIMAPAADMFELGAKVQVLKRGTMFAMRATKLYDLYRVYDAFDQIPDKEKGFIESELLKLSFEQAWEQTKQFFATRDPSQIDRAHNEPKHKMALVFRSYLGQASLWAKKGDRTRQIDYQIWCGPAMGAFNSWVKGSFLEKTENRRTDLVALNLLYGASVLVRHHWLRCQGISLPADTTSLRPMTKEEIDKKLD